jgi:hypothetical protein
MARTYKPRKKQHDRQTLIEQAYRNSIAYKITLAETPEAKRVLVAEHNPTHYIFGNTLRPWKPYLTYLENMEQPNGERA